MGAKVFISYSHKDELLKQSLEEHISGLRRNGLITAWNDRMIQPGNDWATEISSNLADANIILFLVSASFINSDYCMNIEAKMAIDMHNQSKAILIPVIVRPCMWRESGLSKFQGLPTDAIPITSWSNEDEAWVTVVDGIQKAIANLDDLVTTPIIPTSIPEVSADTLQWLNDTEITLSHRRVNKILLSDIYVVPDIEILEENIRETIVIKSVKEGISLPGKYIVSGEEQQGKTSYLNIFI